MLVEASGFSSGPTKSDQLIKRGQLQQPSLEVRDSFAVPWIPRGAFGAGRNSAAKPPRRLVWTARGGSLRSEGSVWPRFGAIFGVIGLAVSGSCRSQKLWFPFNLPLRGWL